MSLVAISMLVCTILYLIDKNSKWAWFGSAIVTLLAGIVTRVFCAIITFGALTELRAFPALDISGPLDMLAAFTIIYFLWWPIMAWFTPWAWKLWKLSRVKKPGSIEEAYFPTATR